MLESSGLSFTLIEAPNPMDEPESISGYNARERFVVAHRVWLGWNAGTDWLHEAIEAEFGEDAMWYDVRSKRDATHIGASAETAAVVLILMGALDFLRQYYSGFAQRLGEVSADSLLEWVRRQSRERRRARDIEWTDGPPDLADRSIEALSWGMTGELADVLDIPEERLELVSAERRESLALFAVYRDTTTGREYTVEAARDAAIFRPRS